MTLKEKLHKIYDSVDHIPKLGFNKKQNYAFIQAADATRAIRAQLSELKVYAEINFDFAGPSYTIARSSDPNAPFTAVNVKCSVVFHDLESAETLTGSGLGSGADMGDKAAFKAQTGALKYALKNAFLVPDEADPEADESVDEGRQGGAPSFDETPDFQDARHAAPRQNTERPTQAVRDPYHHAVAQDVPAAVSSNQPAPSTETQTLFGAADAVAPLKTETAPAAVREPGDDEELLTTGVLPTEEQMVDYRNRFTKLANELSTNGKLTASGGIKLNRKLLVFLLSVERVDDAKNLTTVHWDDFFNRVDAVITTEDGLKGLAKLVNKANGIEPKSKK